MPEAKLIPQPVVIKPAGGETLPIELPNDVRAIGATAVDPIPTLPVGSQAEHAKEAVSIAPIIASNTESIQVEERDLPQAEKKSMLDRTQWITYKFNPIADIQNAPEWIALQKRYRRKEPV